MCGAAGSKYLFAVDPDGQSLVAIDLELCAAERVRCEAKLTRIPVPHQRSPTASHELSVTADGKTVVYHEQNYLALISVGDGTFTLQGPLQGPNRPGDNVHASANPQKLIYRAMADSRTTRGSWEIRDLALPQGPGARYPIEQRSSTPDVDPLSGAILKADKRVFSVLDGKGLPRKTLSLDDAIQHAQNDFQRARASGSESAGPSIESGILANPRGHRCLVWGDTWGVWLEWDDDKPASPADDKAAQPEAP